MFNRSLKTGLEKSLKSEKLFIKHLHDDIKKGIVFPAIRDGYIDFYHAGGRLFTYHSTSSGFAFATHNKYAAALIPKSGTCPDYIDENALERFRTPADFCEAYNRIKEYCAKFTGPEAEGVSIMYHKDPFIRPRKQVVILDIEICMEMVGIQPAGKRKAEKFDRIDILAFHLGQKILRFYEVKRFTDKRILVDKGKHPEVIDQLESYRQSVAHHSDKILKAYKSYVVLMNSLFGINLPEPEKVDENVPLIVFGFDKNQLDGRVSEYIKGNTELNALGNQLRLIGDFSRTTLDNTWKVTS